MFQNESREMRVDVTLLREGLNAIRGLCLQIGGNKEADLDDYQTLVLQIEELCSKTLWKEQEAIDAGFVPAIGGWLPHGTLDVEIVDDM